MSDQKIRIAVSGVGGGVGQSIIKALYDSDYEVIALDGEALGAGLYAADKSYIIPYASDPLYIDRTLEICKKEGCKLFIPGLDAELPILSKSKSRFSDADIYAVVSSPEVVELSDNKLLTYTTLKQHGILVPQTVDMLFYGQKNLTLPSFPFILKKREGGARSQDVYYIDRQEKLDNLVNTGVDVTLFVAQEYIEGDEYTCGSVNFDGNCYGVIVMRRILRDGDTYKCFSVRNEMIESLVRKVMSTIKPFGACNVQLRLKDNKPYVFEINARCSGTTAARALCGFNEPRMIADYLCLNKKPAYAIKEQTILRYWKELVVTNKAVVDIKQKGMLTNNTHPKL